MLKFWANRKFWAWAGKLALVAVPAVISGFSSYAKSKLEAQEKAKASYETLQKAFTESEEADEKDDEALLKRLVALEEEIADLKKENARPLVMLRPPPVAAAPPLILSNSDAGIGLGGIGVLGRGLGSGYGSGAPKPFKKKRAAPPEKFEDAVEQYQLKR